MKKIKYHSHGGFYNDGNSQYWSTDSELDVENNRISGIKEDSYGGQLATNGNHQEEKESFDQEAIRLTDEEQDAIWETLAPIRETYAKYPNLTGYRFFSRRHRYLIEGRISKAIRIAKHSNYYGTNCLRDIWVLQKYNAIITTYSHRKESIWKAKIESLSDN